MNGATRTIGPMTALRAGLLVGGLLFAPRVLFVHAQAPARDTPAAATPASTATIRGRVSRADTGAPLRAARVWLMATGVRNPPVTTSDADGRFELTGVPAGSFVLSASKTGYVTARFGQMRPQQAGQSVDVAEGQVVESVDVALVRGAVVAGRMVDARGDPVVGVAVQLLRTQFVQGRPRMLSGVADGDITDERGQFRLYGIPPGGYALGAIVPRPPRLDGPDTGPSQVVSFGVGGTTMFYPGTASVSEAQMLTVEAGRDLAPLTFELPATRLATISGTVYTADGRPATSATLSLGQPIAFEIGGISSSGAAVGPDGTFSLPDLPPGVYTLEARARDDRNTSATSVVVLDGVNQSLALVLGSGFVLRGRVAFDPTPRPGLQPSIGLFSLPASDPDVMAMTGTVPTMHDDWTFEVQGVAGTRRLDVRPPAGWTLKSVRRGNVDLTDLPLHFDNADIDGVEILLTNRFTDAAITVRDQRGQPTSEATVVLFAEDRAKWSNASRNVAVVRPNQRGRFLTRGLPPGRYFAVAVGSLEPGEETNPSTLDTLQSSATRITLAEEQSLSVELTLMPTP